MLVAEASEQKLDGQVFWLTALDGTPDRLPAYRQWHALSGSLAEYSGGPTTDSHRLPYYPSDRCSRTEGTCRERALDPAEHFSVKSRSPNPNETSSLIEDF